MKFSTITIRNRKIDVHVDGSGEFSAEVSGNDVSSVTLEGLKEKLERAIKMDKITPIPFLQWNGETLVCGKAVGIHAGNGNLLVKLDGEKGVEQHFRMETAIDPSHLVAYGALCAAVRAAEVAREAFEKKHAFDLKERVKEALAAVGVK